MFPSALPHPHHCNGRDMQGRAVTQGMWLRASQMLADLQMWEEPPNQKSHPASFQLTPDSKAINAYCYTPLSITVAVCRAALLWQQITDTMPSTEENLKKCLEHICREKNGCKSIVSVSCPAKFSVISLDCFSIVIEAQRVKEVCKKFPF